MDRGELEALLSNKNVAAFLMCIREGESSRTPDAYLRRYHPTEVRYITSLARHPQIYEDLPDGSGRRSSAAGAYQFTWTRWSEVNARYGLEDDFSEHSQDLHAVANLHWCGALPHILTGDLKAACEKANDQWASLPGSELQDGGSKIRWARFERVWDEYKGSSAPIRDAAPETPAAPVREPTDHVGPAIPISDFPADLTERPTSEAPMSPALIIALGSTLLKYLPAFGSGSKVSNRNIEMTQELGGELIKIAKEVVPTAVNEQAAVQAIHETPDLQAHFTAQAALKWDDVAPFIQATEKSRADARAFAVQMTSGEGWRALGYAVMIGVMSMAIVIGGGLIMREVLLTEQAWASEVVKADIIGYYKNIGLLVVGFVFGSSYSSHRKDAVKAREEGGA